jgi:hypothetical protein
VKPKTITATVAQAIVSGSSLATGLTGASLGTWIGARTTASRDGTGGAGNRGPRTNTGT